MLEHGVYTLLLDRYYATEAGIPADQAYRIARARTKEEREAADAVLAEFFTLKDGVYTQRRVEAEIEKARRKIEASRSNGRTGGRPKKNPPGSGKETQEKPSGFLSGSKTETQAKALQTPDTRHQTPEESAVALSGAREVADVPRETNAQHFDGWEFVDKRMRPSYPRGVFRDSHWLNAARMVERLVAEGANPDLIAANAQAYCEQQEAAGNTGTKFVMAPTTFLTDGNWKGPFPMPEAPRRPQQESAMDEINRKLAERARDRAAIDGEVLTQGVLQ